MLNNADLFNLNLFLKLFFVKASIPLFKLRFNNMMPLSLISDGLSHALQKVTNEIFIDQFIITDSTLKIIIESS